jgi:alpha/beta superfamily hydrolase
MNKPWLIIQPLEDEVVPADQVLAWTKTLPDSVVVKEFPDTGHYFHGKLIELRELLVAQLLK